MSDFEARPLHLHSIDSLLTDLIGGRSILIGKDELFGLTDNASRSALQWYRARGAGRWGDNATKEHADEIVDAADKFPNEIANSPV